MIVLAKKTDNKKTCTGCKYFATCGDPDRVTTCSGRDVVKPEKQEKSK